MGAARRTEAPRRQLTHGRDISTLAYRVPTAALPWPARGRLHRTNRPPYPRVPERQRPDFSQHSGRSMRTPDSGIKRGLACQHQGECFPALARRLWRRRPLGPHGCGQATDDRANESNRRLLMPASPETSCPAGWRSPSPATRLASNPETGARGVRTTQRPARCACAVPRSGSTGRHGRKAHGVTKTATSASFRRLALAYCPYGFAARQVATFAD
jgi:hypothetical protein